jgi:hypothetical protein
MTGQTSDVEPAKAGEADQIGHADTEDDEQQYAQSFIESTL